METYDFSGWATRSNVLCSDGRTIMPDAFKHCDGQVVPLVWNHQHGQPEAVLGHAELENRPEGVFAYCSFNNTESGENARELVKHGDIGSLSIYANQLKQQGSNVIHGTIREVSLVLAGANPKATIVNVMAHSDEEDPGEAAHIYFDSELFMAHADNEKPEEVKEQPSSDEVSESDETVKDIFESMTEKQKNVVYFLVSKAKQGASGSSKEDISHADNESNSADSNEETIEDVFNSMNEKQKNVAYFLIGSAVEGAPSEENAAKENDKKDEEEPAMKHHIFEPQTSESMDEALVHSEQLETIIKDAKRFGSLKESFLQHADEYGITNIDYLFPDAQTIEKTPDFIKRETGWVSKVMNGTHHTPFSRIKSIHANITADEARARGYIKGKKKVEEVFPLLKRTTDPQTIYKKQKLDRDDIIDITDFDVVTWLKSEMRTMLDEEIARAILIGDGRTSGTDDKIEESHIRPIWKDDDLYTIHATVAQATTGTDDEKAAENAKNLIKAAIRARIDYKGKGEPTMFTTEAQLTEMLLIDDEMGHPLYPNAAALATRMRVKEIVTVPVMENMTDKRTASGKSYQPLAIIVNLSDYNVGADKGGSINMFEDFDIDYNQEKYLIETRCSGAMTTPYGAIALEKEVTGE